MIEIKRPVGSSDLAAYMTGHPEQTPEVAAELKDSALSIVDYVKQTLRGQEGYQPDTAFELMDELRDAGQATAQGFTMPAYSRGSHRISDSQRNVLTGPATFTVAGQSFVLGGPRVETSPTVTTPPGVRDYDRAQAPSTGTVLGAELRFGSEWGEVYHTGSIDRSGLHRVNQILDSLTPLVQGILADRHVAAGSVGDVHAHMSAGASAGAGLFGASSHAGASASAEGGWQPALSEAFQGLQTLREMFAQTGSYPSGHYAVSSSCRVHEEARVLLPPEKRMIRRDVPARETTVPVLFGGYKDTVETQTPLGDIPTGNYITMGTRRE